MRIDKEVLKYWKRTEKEHKRYRYKRKNLCSHRYPYFLRRFDDWSNSGKMIERHCYCFICEKEYIIRLHPKHMQVSDMSFGLKRGEETIEKFRRKLSQIINKYKERMRKNKKEVGGI